MCRATLGTRNKVIRNGCDDDVLAICAHAQCAVQSFVTPEMGTIWTVSLKESVPTLASPMRTDMRRDAEAVLVLVLDLNALHGAPTLRSVPKTTHWQSGEKATERCWS